MNPITETLGKQDVSETDKFLIALDTEAWVMDGFTFQTFKDADSANVQPFVMHGSLTSHVDVANRMAVRIGGKEMLHPKGSYVTLHEWLCKQNDKGAGTFVTVNRTDGLGRSNRNITHFRAVYQDDDKQWSGTYPLEPSIVVQTSEGKYQRLWLVKDEWPADEHGIADYKRCIDGMIANFGNDPKAKDLARVFRLPGMFHRKGEPQMVRILESNENTYTREELVYAFAPMQLGGPAASKGTHSTSGPDELGYVREGGRNDYLFHEASKLRRLGYDQDEIYGLISARNFKVCDPSLPDADVRKIANSASNYPAGKGSFAGNAGSLSNEEWPDPTPLGEDLLPVMPYRDELMPEAARAWVRDAAERLQCPPDFIAVAIIVSMGSVIGRKVGIRPKQHDPWTEFANTWGIVVGRSARKKTPAINEGRYPLRVLAAKAHDQHDADMKAHARAKKTASDPKNFDEPEPQLKRYEVNDFTLEALAEVAISNPNGVQAFSDEIYSLLRSLEDPQNARLRGFLLEGHTGNGSVTFDRIGRGRRHVKHLCLSVLGGIQPSKFHRYMAEALRDGGGDGFIARFALLIWPDIPNAWEHVDRMPDIEAKRRLQVVFDRLDAMAPDPLTHSGVQQDIGFDNEPEGVPYVRLDDEARGLFKDWQAPLQRHLRSEQEHPALESHFGKYEKLVASLSLIFHLADLEPSPQPRFGPVTAKAVRRALAWVEYLESHARRAYGSVTASSATVAREIAKRIVAGHLPPQFTARDIYNNQWTRLDVPSDVKAGLELLVECHWLGADDRKMPGGGRPMTFYRPSPKLESALLREPAKPAEL